MEKSIKLTNLKFPKMIGELRHSNQFLKIFALSTLVMLMMSLGILLVVMNKPALVITLGPDGKSLERIEMPKAEDEIKEAAKKYISKRYMWDSGTVVQKLKESQSFILPQSQKAFQNAVAGIAKFSVEKIVSQRIYPEKMEVSLSKKTIYVSGDRVTAIQGLKAAGNFKLELEFSSGDRTQENPWGIYITKEKEEQ